MAAPKIRFKRDDGSDYPAWEKTKIGDIIEIYNEKVDMNCNLPILTSSKSNGIEYQHEHFGRTQLHDITGYNILPRNYCTYRNRSDGTDFTFNINNLCDKGIVSKFYPVFKGKNSVLYFLTSLLNNERKIIKTIAYTAKGTGQKVLSITDLQKINIYLPCLEEQQKIADFLSNVDDLINSSEDEITKLTALKKGMLQKMFPKQGEKVPEIRFPGFTGNWTQRKLSTLCEKITVGIANSATHAYSNIGVVMFRNQNIKENHLDDSDLIYIDKEFEKKYINKRLKAKDLLVTRTGNPGIACVVPEKYEGAQTFTTLIARLNDEINPHYACQYINSDYGKKYFLSTQIGGGQKNSGAGILEEYPMILPPTFEEQNELANYFSNLDDLIALHQQERDKYRELKKGLLQQMFI